MSVACRFGLHWPCAQPLGADGWEDGWEDEDGSTLATCARCGAVDVERRFRLPRLPLRLRSALGADYLPLVRRSKLVEADRIIASERAASEWAIERHGRSTQEAADLRRRLDRAEKRADAVDGLVRRLSGVEAKRELEGAGGQAQVVVIFPALPDPFDAATVADRLAQELAPHLGAPGYWKRTCDFVTESSRPRR